MQLKGGVLKVAFLLLRKQQVQLLRRLPLTGFDGIWLGSRRRWVSAHCKPVRGHLYTLLVFNFKF